MKQTTRLFIAVLVTIMLVATAQAIAVEMRMRPYDQTYGTSHLALDAITGASYIVIGSAKDMSVIEQAQNAGEEIIVTGETDGIVFYSTSVNPASSTAKKPATCPNCGYELP